MYTDSFRAYDTLDVSEFRHRRVNHSKTFVSKRGHHINGIENFWNQAGGTYAGSTESAKKVSTGS